MVNLLRFRCRVFNSVFLYCLIGDRSQQLVSERWQQDDYDNQVWDEEIRREVQLPVIKDANNIVAHEKRQIQGPTWYWEEAIKDIEW